MSDLLNALDKALSAGEVERAVDLFQTDCYWRDLIYFTWNIKAMEGKERFATCSRRGSPIRSRQTERLGRRGHSETDRIVESWIKFETEVARGFGHMRLKDGRIWTC